MKRILLVAVAIVLPTASSGCKKEDVETLAKIGGRVGDKVQALIPEQTPFGGTWATLTGSLQMRVKSRLQSDRFLADSKLEVRAEGNQIHLKGRLGDPVLKRRAMEMAEATIGVEGVIDEIEIGE